MKRSIVITGASSGIGRACALECARRGFRVFAGVRKTSDADKLTKDAGGDVEPIMIDVTDDDSIARAVEHVGKRCEDGIDGLVNNAGIVVNAPLEFIDIDDLRRQLDVNVTGQIAVTQKFIEMLRRRCGRIVIMGSMVGKVSLPFMGPYCISKFALEAFADSLRMELSPWSMHVAIIEPGPVKTPIWEKSRTDWDRRRLKFPPEADVLYGDTIKAVENACGRMADSAIPVSRVVRATLHALTARRPRIRYPVGREARSMTLLARIVPDRLRDRLVRSSLGLKA